MQMKKPAWQSIPVLDVQNLNQAQLAPGRLSADRPARMLLWSCSREGENRGTARSDSRSRTP